MDIRKDELNKKLGKVVRLGYGSTGNVYYLPKYAKVLKIYLSMLPLKREDEILKFSDVDNNTFIFPEDVLKIDDKVRGYFCRLVRGRNLCAQNPLDVDLSHLLESLKLALEDIKIISNNGIQAYDLTYNIMYNNKGIFVVDTDDYTKSDTDGKKLYHYNLDLFGSGISAFLVDNYFDDFIESNPYLKEMYMQKNIDIIEFVNYFIKYLSEYIGQEIHTLRDATICLNRKKREPIYLRG